MIYFISADFFMFKYLAKKLSTSAPYNLSVLKKQFINKRSFIYYSYLCTIIN